MYGAAADPYCYPGTRILKNRLDLTDQDELSAFEADSVTQRGQEPFPEGGCDTRHYRAFHRHLFQDVYSWAGDYRIVRISRHNSMFCYPEHIDAQMEGLFGRLGVDRHLAGLNADDFARGGAHFLSELNAIHPFREGNGRTQTAFFVMLAELAGHPVDLDKLLPDEFLAAMIAAFNGDETPLAAQIRHLI